MGVPAFLNNLSLVKMNEPNMCIMYYVSLIKGLRCG